MLYRIVAASLFVMTTFAACADKVEVLIDVAMSGLEVRISELPYSKTIERMYIGYDHLGEPRVGIAHRKINSFKPITGLVVIHKTDDGYMLHEAHFPDIEKISRAKDRKQVLTVLEMFKHVPFDPHAEKSAVDGLTGATRYGIRTSGYLNHLARRTALEMEAKPNWPKREVKPQG